MTGLLHCDGYTLRAAVSGSAVSALASPRPRLHFPLPPTDVEDAELHHAWLSADVCGAVQLVHAANYKPEFTQDYSAPARPLAPCRTRSSVCAADRRAEVDAPELLEDMRPLLPALFRSPDSSIGPSDMACG